MTLILTESKLIYPLLNLNLIATASSEAEPAQPTHCLAKYVLDGEIMDSTDADKNYCSGYSDAAPWLKIDMQEQFLVHSVRGDINS